MTEKQKRAIMVKIVAALKALYPTAVCALEWEGVPYRLLVMGRLSAQCTDARVNIVCRELFDVFPDVYSMANADLVEIERIVKPCGLYHTKAKNIKDSAVLLVEKYEGRLPDNMDALLEFPGVGRKIANLLLGDIFGQAAVVCDTHCIRISGRLGMYPEREKNPLKIERILRELIEPSEGADYCHRIVNFGRDVCTARSPHCDVCPLADLCKKREREG